MNFYKRALELKNDTAADRRYLHQNAETGLEMPKAVAYIIKKLTEYGLSPEKCGKGVTARLGGGKPVLLLRADMDALPMEELSGEEFACTTGNAHACGHDMHAAMLLTAARMLKENESELRGTVKFMFQPAEETFEGSRNMIAAGILDNVDAALAFHAAPGRMPPGYYMYNAGGVMMNSVDGFRVDIKGRGGHGAYPNLTADPLRIAAEIFIGLESLIAREADPEKTCVLTVGQLHGGSAANIIPDTAYLEGTLRTNDKAARELLVRRIKEVAQGTAKLYGGEAKITVLSDVPPLICDKKLTETMANCIGESDIPHMQPIPGMKASASEDFAVIAEKVPSAFIYLSAGFSDRRGDHSAHNPEVRFNEEVLPIGAAAAAYCAVNWLAKN